VQPSNNRVNPAEPAAPPLPIVEPPVENLRPSATRAGIVLLCVAIAAVSAGIAAAIAIRGEEVAIPDPIASAPPAPAAKPGESEAPPIVVMPLTDEDTRAKRERASARASERERARERQRAKTTSSAGKSKRAERAKPKPDPAPDPAPDPDPDPRFVERIVEDPGYLTVDAAPYATVYVDGVKIGDTPIVKYALSPGKHKVRAVSSEAGDTWFFNVKIRPGKIVRRRLGAD
jgi:serine/threonine-protein kinase